jgi:hypothetical protein
MHDDTPFTRTIATAAKKTDTPRLRDSLQAIRESRLILCH